MTFRRFLIRFIAIAIVVLALAHPASIRAAEAGRGTQAAAKRHRPHSATRSTRADTEAAREERQRREDLERRVERLEQIYELKEPAMPPAAQR